MRRRCILDQMILNGKLTNATGIYQGDTADVDCHDGHQVIGSKTVSCLPSGHWNETPMCLPRTCPKLHLPKNTKLELRNLSHGMNKVDVTCDLGYILEGNKKVFCQNDGFWSEIPACVPVNCGFPSPVKKGIFLNLTDITYNSTFIVKCDNGYILNGKKLIKCESDGKWEDLPECHPVSCGTPTIPDHAYIYGIEGVTFEDSVSYKCESSYVLFGSNLSKCKNNGKWSAFPACKRRCIEAINVTNGRVIQSNDTNMWLEGDIANIECLSGCKLNGSNVTECLPSGQWSERPSCVRKQCATFETPINAEITSAKQLFYFVNDEVAISCLKGFRLNGSENVRCQENETWSTIPLCAPISCNGPQVESNVLIHNFTGVHYGSTFHVTCKHGFVLTGEDNVRCGSDGNWIGRPVCELIACGLPTVQANAYMLNYKCIVFGCEASFGCRQGFNLIGDGKATCGANGQWSSNYVCMQNRVSSRPRNQNNKHEDSEYPGNHDDFVNQEIPLHPGKKSAHHSSRGTPEIHSDVGIGTMTALFVVIIIIQAFST